MAVYGENSSEKIYLVMGSNVLSTSEIGLTGIRSESWMSSGKDDMTIDLSSVKDQYPLEGNKDLGDIPDNTNFIVIQLVDLSFYKLEIGGTTNRHYGPPILLTMQDLESSHYNIDSDSIQPSGINYIRYLTDSSGDMTSASIHVANPFICFKKDTTTNHLLMSVSDYWNNWVPYSHNATLKGVHVRIWYVK